MIVLYVSAANFTKTFKDFVGFVNNFNSSYDNLVNKITGAVYDIIDPIDNTEKQIKQEMRNLMNYINENANVQKTNAVDSQKIIAQFVQSFDISSSAGNDYEKLYNDYTGDKKDLDSRISGPIEDGPADKLDEIAQNMVDSNSHLIDMANDMNDNFNNGIFNNIEGLLQNGYDGIDEVTGTLGTVTDVLSSVSEYTDMISEYEFLVSFFAYLIPTYVLLFLVGYVLSFIFKCCCSRCLLAWFHCSAFFVTIFVILFSGIFGILYGILDIYCPKLLDLLVDEFNFGEEMGISSENFTQLFECTEKKSLMDLGLDSIIDIRSVTDEIQNVPDQLDDLLNFGNSYDEVKKLLDNFDEGLSFDQIITANGIIVGCETTLPELAGKIGSTQKEVVNNIISLINEKAVDLPNARNKMNGCNQFSKEIIPRVDSTISTINSLVSFAANTFSNIENNVREINCIDTRCVYASIKNPFCGNLVAATGLWSVAATTTIMGLMLMSCAICKRRRQFKSVTITPNDEYEGEDKELAGFSANDDLL